MEQRDNGALPGVAAYRVPGEIIVEQHQQQRDGWNDRVAVIGEPVESLAAARRRGDDALLEGHSDAHAFARRELVVGAEFGGVVAGAGDGGGLFGRARPAGISDEFGDHRAIGQRDRRQRPDDGEIPVIAGGVPEQLVMVGEEPRHTGHGIAHDEMVEARIDEGLGVADLDPGAGADPLGGVGLVMVVKFHRDDGERGIVLRAIVVA